MLISVYQNIQSWKPKVKGFFFKLFFSSKRLQIGSNFQCQTWPTFIIDKTAKVEIGDNVLLRRNVELRAHKNSKLILESNNRIDRGVRLLSNNSAIVKLSNGARVGLYSVFNGGDSITVGEKVLISGFVYLQTSIHNHKKGESIQNQGYTHGPVVLEKDVWLGAHVVVLPNCIIGEGAVVGSNAVVTKSIDANAVVGGVPAKTIKTRTE